MTNARGNASAAVRAALFFVLAIVLGGCASQDLESVAQRARSGGPASQEAMAQLEEATYWLGVAYQERGEPAKAASFLLPVSMHASLPVYRGWSLLRLGELSIPAGDAAGAREYLAQAATILASDAEAQQRIAEARKKLAALPVLPAPAPAPAAAPSLDRGH